MMQRYALPDAPAHVQRNNWSVIIPEERTNLIKNPSFEIDTSNWLVAGGGSITRITTESRFGGACARIADAVGGPTGAAYQTVAGLTVGEVYVLSAWVKNESAAGNNLYMRISNATPPLSVAQVAIKHRYWHRVIVRWTATEDTAVIAFDAIEASMVVDGVQLERGAYETTYIDGDQDGCHWIGQDHVSQSRRLSNARQGGRVVNLKTFGFAVLAAVGWGAPPINTISMDYALGGAQYQRSVTPARNAAIVGAFQAESLTELKRNKRDLFAALNPSRVSPQQPARLVYQRVDVFDQPIEDPLYIDAVYTGGLEGNEASEVSEGVSLNFRMHLPYLATGDGDVGFTMQNYSTSDTVIFRAPNTRMWAGAGFYPLAVTAGPVEDLRRRVVYVANGDTVRAKEDGGPGLVVIGTAIGTIKAMAIGPDGYLYVGGSFSQVDGVAATNLARWDGANWSAVGAGFGSTVNALLWFNKVLCIAGDTFEMWSSTSWAATYTFLPVGPTLFAGTGATPKFYAIATDYAKSIWVATNLQTSVSGSTRQHQGLVRLSINPGPILEDTPSTMHLNAPATHLAVSQNRSVYVAGTFTSAGGNADAARLFLITSALSMETIPLGAFRGGTPTALHIGRDDTIYIALSTASGNTELASGRTIIGTEMVYKSPTGDWTHSGVSPDPGGGDTVGILDSVSAGLVVASSVAQAYPYSIKLNSGASTNVPFVFVITGEATPIVIRNENTGKELYFDGGLQLTANERVTIKTGPDASITSNIRGDLIEYLSAGSNLFTFTLAPGENVITTLALRTNGAGKIAWYVRPRYDSIDR